MNLQANWTFYNPFLCKLERQWTYMNLGAVHTARCLAVEESQSVIINYQTLQLPTQISLKIQKILPKNILNMTYFCSINIMILVPQKSILLFFFLVDCWAIDCPWHVVLLTSRWLAVLLLIMGWHWCCHCFGNVTGNSSWECNRRKRRMMQSGSYWWGRLCRPKPYLPYLCPAGKGRINYRMPKNVMRLEASDCN